MGNKSAIILKTESNVTNNEVLFSPALDIIINNCKNAGISSINIDNENSEEKLDGEILFLFDDLPLIDSNIINAAYKAHHERHNTLTVIKTDLSSPACGGWCDLELIRQSKPSDDKNSVLHYIFLLLMDLNNQSHVYLCEDKNSGLRADSQRNILKINEIARRKVIDRHLDNGVVFVSLDGIIITQEVSIGAGTVILPGTILKGNTDIGSGCIIGPNSLVENSSIADNTKFNSSQCYNSSIGSGVSIGPFCHIRPNSKILDSVHLGDFVEIKNSTIGKSTHVSHLTYVGDSDVGERVNFGCGVVTVNYNGKSKARCTIGDDAFIGCNTNLVAPVTIGDNGYTAAGSTITDNVPNEGLAIARARQVNKDGYNKKLRG